MDYFLSAELNPGSCPGFLFYFVSSLLVCHIQLHTSCLCPFPALFTVHLCFICWLVSDMPFKMKHVLLYERKSTYGSALTDTLLHMNIISQSNMACYKPYLKSDLPWMVARLENTDRSFSSLGHDWMLRISNNKKQMILKRCHQIITRNVGNQNKIYWHLLRNRW